MAAPVKYCPVHPAQQMDLVVESKIKGENQIVRLYSCPLENADHGATSIENHDSAHKERILNRDPLEVANP